MNLVKQSISYYFFVRTFFFFKKRIFHTFSISYYFVPVMTRQNFEKCMKWVLLQSILMIFWFHGWYYFISKQWQRSSPSDHISYYFEDKKYHFVFSFQRSDFPNFILFWHYFQPFFHTDILGDAWQVFHYFSHLTHFKFHYHFTSISSSECTFLKNHIMNA